MAESWDEPFPPAVANDSDLEGPRKTSGYRPPLMRAVQVLGAVVGLLWAASVFFALVRFQDRAEFRFDILTLFLIVVVIDQRLEIRWLRLHPEAR